MGVPCRFNFAAGTPEAYIPFGRRVKFAVAFFLHPAHFGVGSFVPCEPSIFVPVMGRLPQHVTCAVVHDDIGFRVEMGKYPLPPTSATAGFYQIVDHIREILPIKVNPPHADHLPLQDQRLVILAHVGEEPPACVRRRAVEGGTALHFNGDVPLWERYVERPCLIRVELAFIDRSVVRRCPFNSIFKQRLTLSGGVCVFGLNRAFSQD